ncbi:monocarboxylate transporter 2-like [Macrobrachium nipponense]|uniref:monocarboxylate transporter 2-like n=1 Tax=Macrobrachium nipponense TaxID=159736 RepID=UPI0030C7E410
MNCDLTTNRSSLQEVSYSMHHGPTKLKDSRYAWFMLLLVLLVNFVVAGNFNSFGITYTIIRDYFSDASGSETGWILGLLMGCRCLLSPFMGALAMVIGPRKCIVLGGFLCAGSLLLAVPAYSVVHMAVTLGALFGTGMCMAETPGYFIVTDYFDKHNAIANGIRSAGNPMGGLVFSPLVVLLHQKFGFQGAFVMMAGITLHLILIGMLVRSFEQQKTILEARRWQEMLSSKQNARLRSLSLQLQDVRRAKRKPLDCGFFKNPLYLTYLFVVVSTTAALPNALFYLPVYGKSIGLTDMQNSMLCSYHDLCDLAMRLFCGWVFSHKTLNKIHGFVAGLVVGAAGCLVTPLCGSLWQLIIPTTMFALCMGFFWTLINVLLKDQFGGEAMSSTWGFFRMVQGICSFMYPPFIGFIMDYSGGMTTPYVFMGSMLALAAVTFSSQYFWTRKTDLVTDDNSD